MTEKKAKIGRKKRSYFRLSDIHWRIMKYQYAGYSVARIARIIHRSSSTVTKWMKHPKYIEAYAMYSEKMDKIEDDRFSYLHGIVNDQFEEILTGKKVSDSVRLRAIELFWKKEGKLVNEFNIKGSIDVSEKSTKELEENVERLKEKLMQLAGITGGGKGITGNQEEGENN